MFHRRLAVFGVGLALAMAVLAGRLAWLQLVRGEHYVELSQEALEVPGRFLQTVRGRVLDRGGRVLGVDRPSYEVQVNWRLARLFSARYQAWVGMRDAAWPEEGYWAGYEEELARAVGMLGDISDICLVSDGVLLARLEEINERVYALAALQAMKKVYRERGEEWPYRVGLGVEQIWQRFGELVETEADRLAELHDSSNAVLEMHQGQVLVEDIGEDAALTIEERLVGMLLGGSGIGRRMVWVETGKVREYPYGRVACHLVGQMMPVGQVGGWQGEGDPNERELGGYRAGDRQGEFGAERLFEERLRGRRGWVRRDRQGQELARVEPVWGADVMLSVDAELQERAERVLGGENPLGEAFRGAAVVVDVGSGEVLAAASAPGFDLNRYYEPEVYAELNEVGGRKDPLRRKHNRAVSVNYQPGSTIKPTVLMGGYEMGVEVGEFECRPNYINIMPRSLCSQYGHGWLGAEEAIQRSCGFYFIELGRRMGVEAEVDWLRRAGYGRRTLAWPVGVSEGEAWGAFRETRGNLGRGGRVSGLDQAYMSAGLAVVDGSMVQVANAMATLARGGVWVAPALVHRPGAEQETVRLAGAESARRVHAGMWAAVNERGGTAYEGFRSVSWVGQEVRVYGKTGSTSDHSLFAGFARAGDGRSVALGVLVEDDRGGGKVAAPLGAEIFAACGEVGYLPAAVRREGAEEE